VATGSRENTSKPKDLETDQIHLNGL